MCFIVSEEDRPAEEGDGSDNTGGGASPEDGELSAASSVGQLIAEVERTSGRPPTASGVAATEAARPGGTTAREKTDKDNRRPTGTQGIEPRSHTGSGAGTGILAEPEPSDERKGKNQLEGSVSTC